MRHVVHILEATTGGTRRHLRDVVTGLDPALIRQSVIASPLRDPGFLDDVALFRERGVAVHLVPMLRRPSPLGDAAAAFRILRLLRAAAPDVVHTHSSKAGFLGRWAARAAGVAVRVHSPHVFAFEMSISPALQAVYRTAERLAARWTTTLVCVSEAEARTAGRLGRHRPPVRVVHNGVEIPQGPPAPLLARNPLHVALIGRMCPQKGQDTLAAALRQAPELASRLRVELAGVEPGAKLPGEVRAALESGLCHRMAPLSPERMRAYLETVDVVAMPSRWEGLPYTLLEAMAAGRCVLAAPVGGVPEVVTDGVDGRLVAPDDPAAWAAALRDVADHPAQARAWGAAARETVLRKFRKDAMLDSLTELYLENGR